MAHDPGTIKVEAVNIDRLPEGFGLLYRVLPAGGWRLREYDRHGDEQLPRPRVQEPRSDQ